MHTEGQLIVSRLHLFYESGFCFYDWQMMDCHLKTAFELPLYLCVVQGKENLSLHFSNSEGFSFFFRATSTTTRKIESSSAAFTRNRVKLALIWGSTVGWRRPWRKLRRSCVDSEILSFFICPFLDSSRLRTKNDPIVVSSLEIYSGQYSVYAMFIRFFCFFSRRLFLRCWFFLVHCCCYK